MNRRQLLGRFAAIAAAVTVAPAVTAEAAPTQHPNNAYLLGYARATNVALDAVAEARAEGYERGRAIRDAAQESGYLRTLEAQVMQSAGGTWAVELGMHPPLTFEVMQADCEARGCQIEDLGRGVYGHEFVHTGRLGNGDTVREPFLAANVGWPEVNAWRRGLHEQAKAESRHLMPRNYDPRTGEYSLL